MEYNNAHDFVISFGYIYLLHCGKLFVLMNRISSVNNIQNAVNTLQWKCESGYQLNKCNWIQPVAIKSNVSLSFSACSIMRKH